MNKFRWLTALGIICVIAVILYGLIEYQSISAFMLLGIILSFIVIGLGEILYFLQNRKLKNKGDEKDERDEKN